MEVDGYLRSMRPEPWDNCLPPDCMSPTIVCRGDADHPTRCKHHSCFSDGAAETHPRALAPGRPQSMVKLCCSLALQVSMSGHHHSHCTYCVSTVSLLPGLSVGHLCCETLQGHLGVLVLDRL
jgi:hypothetical protein